MNKNYTKIAIIISLVQLITIGTLVFVCVRQNELIENNKKINEINDIVTSGELAKVEDIPTKMSELENDLTSENNEYITSEQLESFINKKGFASTYTLNQINDKFQKQIDELNNRGFSNTTIVTNGGSSVSLDNVKEYVLSTFFPVGSLYYSLDKDFNPNTAWGGSWEKIDEGNFIEATEDGTKVANHIDAGLPNITGKISWSQGGQGHTELWVADGAFEKEPSVSATYPAPNASSNSSRGFNIDASRSSSVYGNSDTVQPNAYYAYIWKRIS